MTDQVFDLDAFVAETVYAPFVFQFGGEKFEVAGHYDPRVWRRLTTGDFGGALAMMMTVEQLARLDAVDKPFTSQHFLALLNAWADHFQTTVGEAKASSRSSKRAEAKSKLTSNGSTA